MSDSRSVKEEREKESESVCVWENFMPIQTYLKVSVNISNFIQEQKNKEILDGNPYKYFQWNLDLTFIWILEPKKGNTARFP